MITSIFCVLASASLSTPMTNSCEFLPLISFKFTNSGMKCKLLTQCSIFQVWFAIITECMAIVISDVSCLCTIFCGFALLSGGFKIEPICLFVLTVLTINLLLQQSAWDLKCQHKVSLFLKITPQTLMKWCLEYKLPVKKTSLISCDLFLLFTFIQKCEHPTTIIEMKYEYVPRVDDYKIPKFAFVQHYRLPQVLLLLNIDSKKLIVVLLV